MTFHIYHKSGNASLIYHLELSDTSSVPHSDTRSFVLLRQSQFCIVEGKEVKHWLLEKGNSCQKWGATTEARETTRCSVRSPSNTSHRTGHLLLDEILYSLCFSHSHFLHLISIPHTNISNISSNLYSDYPWIILLIHDCRSRTWASHKHTLDHSKSPNFIKMYKFISRI